MKKILGFVILIGFVIMLGAAGSADVAGMSFLKVLLLEVFGMLITTIGTSAFMHYNVYLRRTRRRRVSRRKVASSEIRVAKQIKIPEKELC